MATKLVFNATNSSNRRQAMVVRGLDKALITIFVIWVYERVGVLR